MHVFRSGVSKKGSSSIADRCSVLLAGVICEESFSQAMGANDAPSTLLLTYPWLTAYSDIVFPTAPSFGCRELFPLSFFFFFLTNQKIRCRGTVVQQLRKIVKKKNTDKLLEKGRLLFLGNC